MQTIGIHKRDVVPSELTLDWCVDIVRTCGKRLSTICILANTKINHVSVANDAYEQLQVQLRRGAGSGDGKTNLSQSQQQNSGIDYGGGGVGGRDFLNSDLYSFDPRGSSSRRSSHQQNIASSASALVKPTTPTSSASPFGGLAVSTKEKRLILRVEAARAMLQEVATYIRHRLAEEESKGREGGGSGHMYTHDKDYSLYKAVGTMHHWLLADETLPAETEEQHMLMRLDDANANRSSSYTAPSTTQVSIAALLVDKREVPRYSYGALLELISETDVGLLSREFFPQETLTDEAKRQLKEAGTRANGGLHWPPVAADGIQGCEALNEALTPPPLPDIRDEEDVRSSAASNRSPSRLSVSRERSPSAASPTATSALFFSPSEFITPSFTQALQAHVRDIFRVWAQAMTTYFLHCEIMEDMERQRAKREREMREQQKKEQQQAAAMTIEAARKERERQEREAAQVELEKKEKERCERELQQRKAEEEKEKEKAEEEARQRRLLKEREAAAEAVRHKLRLERIEQEAAAERERLAAEALELERDRQRREEASRKKKEQEERDREEERKALRLRELRRVELEAEDEAHRLAIEDARRKRNEELARLEAERRHLAEEEQSIEEMRRRQLRAKEELAAEEETARLRAVALAAELREKELAAQLEKDRLARIAREAEQKRLEAEAEARRLAEEEEKAHNQRRKAAIVQKKRLDTTLLSDVEDIEELTDRSRIIGEESSDRQWLSTLASQEAKAAAARERESKARREEEELRRQLDQAEERLRYRLARQKAEELERLRREEEEQQRLAEHLEAQRSAVEHYEEAPSRREIEEEESLAWRESLLSKALINKEKALIRQQERNEREKAEALRRAQEAERLLREAKAAEAAEKKRRKEAEEEAERVRLAEELLEKERRRRIAAEREAEEERRRRREKEEEAAAAAAEAKAQVEYERRLAALAAAKKKEQEEAEAQRQQQAQEEAEQRRSTSRLKAAAPRPMLISHCASGETDEDSDDELIVVGDDGKVTRVKRGVGEGDDDLRRRVEALERGNRYLCEVVDGINTSHVRLHRHVLETTSTMNTTTTTTTQNNNDANSLFGGGSSAAVSPNRASPQRGPASSHSSSYVRNKTANVMRMSRALDPMFAEELPLPKTEELAIPRRIGGGGGNTSSSRSTSQFQTTTQYSHHHINSDGRLADNEYMYGRSQSPAGNAEGPTEEGGQPKVPPPMTGSADEIHTNLQTPLSSPSRFTRREGDGRNAVVNANRSPRSAAITTPASKIAENMSSASSAVRQYGSVADRIRHEVANARPSQRLKSKKPDDASSENTRRGVGDEGSKTNNEVKSSDPLINTQRDIIPRPTNEQRAAEREQLRKIDQLFATMVVTKSPSPSPPSAHRPSTAGPTSARGSSTAPQRTISIGNGGGYGGGTVYGLGGWNMYDETGFSGAVGYLYDSSELDAPYLAVAASAPAWMHPRALQQAREDHLRQIQHAMYGDSLDASASPSAPSSSPSVESALTDEELAIISARQRYEVRVVQQLIREIRSRGGLDPLFEIASVVIARDTVGAAASNAAYPHQHFPTAVPSSLPGPSSSSSSSSSPAPALLPKPCVKLDFSTMTPWIHDTHLLLILNALLDAAKSLPDNAAARTNPPPRGNGYYSHPTRGATHATKAYPNTGEQQRLHSNGHVLLDASELSNISHYSSNSAAAFSYVNSLNTSAAHTAAETQLFGFSKARVGYVARQSAEELAANIAATVRIIDISKCHYVCSDTVLLVLSELVSMCPCLTTVAYNRERFGSGKSGEDGQSPSNSRVARGPGTFATSPVRGHDTYPLSPDMRNMSRAREGGDASNSFHHSAQNRKRPVTASLHNRPSAADGGVGSSIFGQKTTAVPSTPPRRSSYEFANRDPIPKETGSSNSPLTILENALAERAIASARNGW